MIAEGASGALAAFEDRCVIVKNGAGSSWVAAPRGGGRVATFLYADVTGVEYHAGSADGMLEILTPSFQRTAAVHDASRGTSGRRNAVATDAPAPSNVLPLSKSLHERARPQLDELRRMIAEARRSRVAVPDRDVDRGTLVDELAELGRLHAQGVLDADELKRAIHAAIAGAPVS